MMNPQPTGAIKKRDKSLEARQKLSFAKIHKEILRVYEDKKRKELETEFMRNNMQPAFSEREIYLIKKNKIDCVLKLNAEQDPNCASARVLA
jgi:hypothetical protein